MRVLTQLRRVLQGDSAQSCRCDLGDDGIPVSICLSSHCVRPTDGLVFQLGGTYIDNDGQVSFLSAALKYHASQLPSASSKKEHTPLGSMSSCIRRLLDATLHLRVTMKL